jgi:hypothetical protein
VLFGVGGIPTTCRMCFKVLADGLDERRSYENRIRRERTRKNLVHRLRSCSAATIGVPPLLNPPEAFDREGRRQPRN